MDLTTSLALTTSTGTFRENAGERAGSLLSAQLPGPDEVVMNDAGSRTSLSLHARDH